MNFAVLVDAAQELSPSVMLFNGTNKEKALEKAIARYFENEKDFDQAEWSEITKENGHSPWPSITLVNPTLEKERCTQIKFQVIELWSLQPMTAD